MQPKLPNLAWNLQSARRQLFCYPLEARKMLQALQAEWRCRYTHTNTHWDRFDVQFLWGGTAPLWLSSFESRGEGWGSRSSTAVLLDPTLLDAQNNGPSIALTYFALHKLYHSPILPHAQTLFVALESFPVWKCYEKVSHILTPLLALTRPLLHFIFQNL